MVTSTIRETALDRFFLTILYIILFLVLVSILYPLYFVVIASFSDPHAVNQGRVIFLPEGFTLEGYRFLIHDPLIPRGYLNTIIITVAGTAIGVFFTLTAAFALANKRLFARRFVTGFFAFTMFFNGGIIPTYILIRNLGMLNTLWALILPGCVGAWNLFLVRTFYMSTIPEELYEAATVDGASVTWYFYRVVLPLSSAIISVMILYHAVGYWNMFFAALLYIRDAALFPLQMVLRNIILVNEALALSELDAETVAGKQRMADLLRYSSMIAASAPLLIAYPFLQKYFAQGILAGSIKG